MKPPANISSESSGSSRRANGPIVTVSKAEIVEERGNAISARLGMPVQTWEMRATHPDETVLRQDKPLGLRVRWYCHRCQSGITSQGSCSNCSHARCRVCIRLNAHQYADDDVVGPSSTVRRHHTREERCIASEPGASEAGVVRQRRKHAGGGPDLVLRKPRLRVRRTCHVCKADFAQLRQTICEKCQHIRCTDCPRDPPKHSKYPFGYPGDVFGPNSIAHYECVKCWALYPTHAENGTPCRRCGEPKSDNSPRAQPRAVDLDYDPTFLMKLEAKLDALQAQGGNPFPGKEE